MSTPIHVRKQLIIPAEIDKRWTAIAIDAATTTSEVVRKTFSLYVISTEKKQQGLRKVCKTPRHSDWRRV